MKKITFHVAWPFSGSEVRELLSFAFQVSLVAFLVFYLIDNLRAGFISNFFNSNIFLWAAIFFGIFSYVWPSISSHKDLRKSWIKFMWLGGLSLIVGFAVWQKINDFFETSIIAVFFSIFIALLIPVFYYQQDQN